MDNKQLWDSVLLEVELSVSKANFSTWFKNTHVVKQKDGVVYVGVPNGFIKEWLTSKYNKFILRCLRNTSESVRNVEYLVVSPGAKDKGATEKTKPFYAQELPLHDLYINRENNLNPRYTFDNLIVGPFNELAHAGAQGVVAQPGRSYNPFFVYGGTGMGKTHMIQAIGNSIKDQKTNKRVYYVTSEKFLMDYTTSVQGNRVNDFKERYRRYDALIMDDIHFLAGKEKTQEELFHLFNAMYESNRQIIFSSDKHPNYLNNLEERLRTRFSAGMIVDISMPEYESRIAIINHKARIGNTIFGEETVHFIAASLECSVREIEGVLNAIFCQAKLKSKELSLNEIRNLIKNNIAPRRQSSIKDIITAVSEFYRIEESILFEKTRRKEVVKPRQIAMYILREDFSISYPTIGERFGGRDHTTVIHSCEKIKRDIKVDATLAEEVEQIRAML